MQRDGAVSGPIGALILSGLLTASGGGSHCAYRARGLVRCGNLRIEGWRQLAAV